MFYLFEVGFNMFSFLNFNVVDLLKFNFELWFILVDDLKME